MIDTILQENDLILGWTSCEKEFKQLHREIVDFNLEFLLESLGSCRKPLPERRVNVLETDNLVLKAAKLAAEYSESVVKLPLANEKMRSISDAMKDYASQIPRLVNESYAAFKQAKPDKIVAKRYALDFIEYCRIGERYGFAPWFKERKLRRTVDFVKKCEEEEKKALAEAARQRYNALKENINRIHAALVNNDRQKIADLARLPVEASGAQMDVAKEYNTLVWHCRYLAGGPYSSEESQKIRANNSPTIKNKPFNFFAYVRDLDSPQAYLLRELRSVLLTGNLDTRLREMEQVLVKIAADSSLSNNPWLEMVRAGYEKDTASGYIAASRDKDLPRIARIRKLLEITTEYSASQK